MSHPDILQLYADRLDELRRQDALRQFRQLHHQADHIEYQGRRLLNLASNDYLSLASCPVLRQEFLEQAHYYPLGSSSSRLLTGNFAIYEQLEQRLTQLFQKSALLFNSGYHANLGVLSALCDEGTLVLADKLVHASMIDGILLSKAKLPGLKFFRYPHQDLSQLEKLICRHHDDLTIKKILVVTESVFSMDGDQSDLKSLVALKNKYKKVMLYVDEAHAVGVMGDQGLGCAESWGVISDIDFIVGAFGKAIGSVGGYVLCHQIFRDFLVNTARPLIFSTALPPMNLAWTDFIIERLPSLSDRRQRLMDYAQSLIGFVQGLGLQCPSSSQIIPVIMGDNAAALVAAQKLSDCGIYALAVRPPTVPKNQSRLRICLHSQLTEQQLGLLKQSLEKLV